MQTKAILNHLKEHGEQLDSDIAAALRIPLDQVQAHLAQLSAKNKVLTYHSTRLREGKKTEGVRCRLAVQTCVPGSMQGPVTLCSEKYFEPTSAQWKFLI